MLDSDIIYTIARTIPESIAVIFAGLSLLRIKKDKFYILKQGILLGVTIFIIRSLPISFGIHTILSMIVLGLMLSNVYKKSIIKPIIVTCVTLILLSLSEAIYMVIATGIFKIEFESLINNSGLYGAIITLPSLLIFLGIVVIFSRLQSTITEIS